MSLYLVRGPRGDTQWFGQSDVVKAECDARDEWGSLRREVELVGAAGGDRPHAHSEKKKEKREKQGVEKKEKREKQSMEKKEKREKQGTDTRAAAKE
eukprot:gene22767-42899_t